MAAHSSILAWRIPSTEEPGGLRSVELQRLQHDWNDSADTTQCTDRILFFLLDSSGEARLLRPTLVLFSVLPGQEFVFNFYSALSTPFSLFY